ncbi:MAG: universal stress protein [Candidatus Obscuribacterales bacterium]|nr:universal stress protein [Candidatus Obscuribacterales bacterium]
MKILVAVDGSDYSTNAVEFIAGRPWGEDDQFLFLSVAEPIPQEYGIGYMPTPTNAMEQRMYDDCAKNCGTAAAKIQEILKTQRVEVKVVLGFAAKTICEYAESWSADLIVLGSHGRKGIAHFLIGSVAEEVLKNAPCSVEIVKFKKKSPTEAVAIGKNKSNPLN